MSEGRKGGKKDKSTLPLADRLGLPVLRPTPPTFDAFCREESLQGFPAADCGVPFSFFLAGSAQGHALIQRHVVAHNRRLANHHAHSVIDEQSPSDLCARVNSQCL